MHQALMIAHVASYFLSEFPKRLPKVTIKQMKGLGEDFESPPDAAEALKLIDYDPDLEPEKELAAKLHWELLPYSIFQFLQSRATYTDTPDTGAFVGSAVGNQAFTFVISAFEAYVNDLATLSARQNPDFYNADGVEERWPRGVIYKILSDPDSAVEASLTIESKFNTWFNNKPLVEKVKWLLKNLKVPNSDHFTPANTKVPLGAHESIERGIICLQAYRAAILHHGSKLTKSHASIVKCHPNTGVEFELHQLENARSDLLSLISSIHESFDALFVDTPDRRMSAAAGDIYVNTATHRRWQFDFDSLFASSFDDL